MKLKTLLMAGAVSLMATAAAQADCAFENDVQVKSLSAGFEAWKAVTDAMAECGNVEAELDQEFRTKQPAAFAANPSLYQIGGVSNGTVTPLLNEGTIRPLDDLVAAHGQNLAPNQLIKIDGQTMAVAMMVNTQHLMYRQDIFDDLGLEVPSTWDGVLEAAAAIKEAGVVDYPLGATMKSGWNLAQDFNNMFLGFGGVFTDADSMPTVNTEAGMKALDMMMRMTEYKVNAAAAPLAMEGGAPATTLWWDGIVIAKNISDEEADAAFRVAMEGLDTEMVTANNDEAIWLISGYQPNRLAEGAIATASADPAPQSYPSTSQMGLMHTALGNELPAFFTGERDAAATLEAVEGAYVTAAKEAGLIE